MIAAILASFGLGGFYRYTSSVWNDDVSINGPFRTRKSANPAAGARLYHVNHEVKFHFGPPKGAKKPPRIR